MTVVLLVPVAQHQTRFVAPGLKTDARGVATGRVAAMLLPSLDRVVAALSTLTGELAQPELYAALVVDRVRSALGTVEFLLRFDAGDTPRLDRLARVAGLGGGELFTGEARHLVRYRDRKSPLGYDVDRLVEGEADVVLYGRVAEGPYAVVEGLPLRSLLLRLAPEPVRRRGLDPETLLVLAPPGLRADLEAYLWRCGVDAEVVRAEVDDGELFLYRARDLPPRVRHRLGATPGVRLLVPEGTRAAVEQGFRHPFDLAACADALGDDALWLFLGNRPGARVIHGELGWLPLRRGVRPDLGAEAAGATAADPGEPVDVPLRLAPDHRGLGPPEALLIPPRQLSAFRHLVYALPPATLERYRAVSLDRGLLVVGEGAVEELPLGLPLRRVGAQVLVPLGQVVVPRLPPALVAEALGVGQGELAVLPGGDAAPFTVAESALMPLSRRLVAQVEVPPAAVAETGEVAGAPKVVFDDAGPFPLWGRRFPTGGGG